MYAAEWRRFYVSKIDDNTKLLNDLSSARFSNPNVFIFETQQLPCALGFDMDSRAF